MPKVSVIVPMYNAEDTICRCLDSILASTVDFEILLIDDGSNDKTAMICDEYKKKNANIYVYNQIRGGVSRARNVGLDHARGRYIAFVDSDDEVQPKMLEKMLEAYDSKTDIVICGFASERIKIADTPAQEKNYDDVLMGILANPSIMGVPWNKLFRKEVIDKYEIRFNTQIHDMEDKLFCLEYWNRCANKGKFIDMPLYIYKDYGNAFSRKYPYDKYKTEYDACKMILDLPCVKNNATAADTEKAILVKHCIQIARVAIRNNKVSDLSKYKNTSYLYKKEFFECGSVKRKQKVGWYVLQYFPLMLKFI